MSCIGDFKTIQGSLTPVHIPFATLFSERPLLVRRFLRSVLRIEELQDLYLEARRDGVPLAEAVMSYLGVKLQIDEQDLARIPATGPVVAVANHPHGLLDGLLIQGVLQRARNDIKVLANELVCGYEEFRDYTISVDVLGGKRASRQNLKAVRSAMAWLKEGHGVAAFPAGEVSHWNAEERCVTDPKWEGFVIRCARMAKAPVVPIYIDGHNSLTFQMVGLLHPTLRTARLPSELFNKRGATVTVRIGNPITSRELSEIGDEDAALEHIRARTYLLRNRTAAATSGTVRRVFTFNLRRQDPISGPVSGIAEEIERLHSGGKCLVENDHYAVFADQGHRIPRLVAEIGRLREFTFRQANEGTGKSSDVDRFDPSYTHLILWHKDSRSVAGSYRLAWTEDALKSNGTDGLYTSKLFRYAPAFFEAVGPAVELGRSFIVPDHQREYGPLFLLWQGIGRCVAARPEAPVLFGAVSISTAYSEAARALIVQFLRERSFRDDLAPFVSARRAFRPRLTRRRELDLVTRCFQDVDDLPIGDVGPHEGVPVLLRQYLRLGGRVAAFNLDSQFSDVLDALLIVDLRLTPRKLLSRYMGSEASKNFLQKAQQQPLVQA